MFDDITVESLRAVVLAGVSSLDTREGSFISDMVTPLCTEIWKCYQAMQALVPIAYVDESSGGYIDLRASEYGIYRKAGTAATVILSFTGTVGAVIPAGISLVTPAGLVFTLNADVTLTDGTGAGVATAEDMGAVYNVAAGQITAVVDAVSGLTSVTNPAAASGGTDDESDAALLLRLYARLQTPATSGNAYHYRQWALEVSGVGEALVLPLWDGPGTVKVILADAAMLPPAAAIVTAAAAYIADNAPIGADVTVAAAAALTVDVAATVTITGGTTKDAVQTALAASLVTYLQSLAFSASTVSYGRIMALIMDIDGVTDCTALTLNGCAASVAISTGQVPVSGTVTVT